MANQEQEITRKSWNLVAKIPPMHFHCNMVDACDLTSVFVQADLMNFYQMLITMGLHHIPEEIRQMEDTPLHLCIQLVQGVQDVVCRSDS